MRLVVAAAACILLLGACASEPGEGECWKVSSWGADDDFYEIVDASEAEGPPQSGVRYECPQPCAPSARPAPCPPPAAASRPTYTYPAPAYAATPQPTYAQPAPAAQPRATTSEAQLRSTLDSLQRLRAQGVLTEQEYQAKRAQVINAYRP